MTITKRSRLSINFVYLLAAVLLPVPASAYKVLLIPQIAKSHIFSMARIAESLADRGHQVAFLAGEHLPLNLAELSNRTNIDVIRYTDTTSDGVALDYNAIGENAAKSAIEVNGSILRVLPIFSKMYVLVHASLWMSLDLSRVLALVLQF